MHEDCTDGFFLRHPTFEEQTSRNSKLLLFHFNLDCFLTPLPQLSSVSDRKRIQIDYNSDFFPIFSASFIFSEVLKEIESKRYFFVIQGKPEIARIHVCGGFLCSLYHTLWKRFFKHHIQTYTYSKNYGHLKKKKKKKRKEKYIVLVKLHTGSSICL